MSASIHILCAGSNLKKTDLIVSGLASNRLRLFPAATAIEDAGYKLSMGDNIPADADLVIVGKLITVDISHRLPSWLRQLREFAASGGKVAIEYTDHHLAIPSPQSPFYAEANHLAHSYIVPSGAMKELMSDSYGRPTYIVEDRLEYPVLPPKSPQHRSGMVLWFGHESNIEFLSNLIDTWPGIKKIKTLLVVSGKSANSLLTSYPYRERPTVNVQCLEWSPQALVLAARQADVALIPSDTSSHKQFASSNRLVTSLALGLPTLATTLASYREFQGCFTDLSSPQAQQVLAKPEEGISGVKLFQEKYLDRFTDAAITECWRTTLSSLLS